MSEKPPLRTPTGMAVAARWPSEAERDASEPRDERRFVMRSGFTSIVCEVVVGRAAEEVKSGGCSRAFAVALCAGRCRGGGGNGGSGVGRYT